MDPPATPNAAAARTSTQSLDKGARLTTPARELQPRGSNANIKKSVSNNGIGEAPNGGDAQQQQQQQQQPPAPPEGLVPLFLSTATQEILKVSDLQEDAPNIATTAPPPTTPPAAAAATPSSTLSQQPDAAPAADASAKKPLKALLGVPSDVKGRFVAKADILADIQNRAAVSDFQPFKQKIIEYPEDDLLLVFDENFIYGQNFFICLSIEAALFVLKPPSSAAESKGSTEELASGEKTLAERPRGWVSQGSEKEIEEMNVHANRELIQVSVSRKRRRFGAAIKMGDRDASEGYIDCKPFKDPNYELERLELDIAVQVVPRTQSQAAQTTWHRPQNMAIQYEPITMTDEQKQEIFNSQEMFDFLNSVVGRVERTLQQNLIIDLFQDDYLELGDEDNVLGQGSNSYLQEYQSFTDLKHSKEKSLSCVDWHPVQKGVVAVSCVQRVTFDERITSVQSTKSHQSLILIWSFFDPIHPQLILEAPDDIQHFQFNPTDPNVIAGGCINGQVVLWDIAEYQDKLKFNRKRDNLSSSAAGGNANASSAVANAEERTKLTEGGGDDSGARTSAIGGMVAAESNSLETPIVRYQVVSSIEGSHRGPIADLFWVSKTIEISANGEVIEATSDMACQLVTSGLDGQVLFWDLRFRKDIKSLDLAWKPFHKVPLSAMDNTFDYGVMKSSIYLRRGSTIFGERDHLPSSAMKLSEKEKSTQFYSATEEGDVTFLDWIADRSEEKGAASRVEGAFSAHSGPVIDIQRSPFFPEILLSVGGWNFHVWKEKITAGPLLSSPHSNSYITSGRWSPTRPGVFYISKADGVVEVWDLLDRSHLPTTVQSISSEGITYLNLQQYQSDKTQYHQLMAAGDDAGTLHILEVPRNLSKPVKNEKAVMEAFFERELRRINYVQERRQIRAKERPAKIERLPNTDAAPAKAAKKEEAYPVIDDDEAIEKEYLAMEKAFKDELGIKSEEESNPAR